MMSSPLASIVVINKNERTLADTLAALRSIDRPVPFEVIVVDASSKKLDDIRVQFPEVRWFDFAPIPGKRYWIPEQRNFGVAQAKGEIIVFTDASCIPAKDWLKHLLTPILEGMECIVAGVAHSRGERTIHDQSGEARQSIAYIHECPTINLAFQRKVFDDIGGFDSRFDYGSDVDFSWRVYDKGYKVRYVPEAQVAHDWGDTKANIKRSYLYGVARARLYKKHPRRLKYILSRDVTAVIYPVYLLGLPLTWWFWPYPLLILVPLLKNMRDQPLRVLQNHLVYAWGVLRELVRL